MAVAPFFLSKEERVQMRTEKFFHKALNNLAGLDDTSLSVYLNCKATTWYRQFPPVHSPDRAEDPRRPRLPVVMKRGSRPRMRTMLQSALWRPSLLRRGQRRGPGIKPDQLMCYIPCMLYLTCATKQRCYILHVLYSRGYIPPNPFQRPIENDAYKSV